jgi:PKD repeat protein
VPARFPALSPLSAALLTLFACACSAGTLSSRDTAIRELAALPTPAAVDPDLFATIKAVFARELEAAGGIRSVAALPGGDGALVDDLGITIQGATIELNWTFVSPGDYDQNGEVNISDLTPIGVHFRKTTAAPDWPVARTADGDGNGEVNLADITAIAQNYGATVGAYRLQSTTTAGAPGSWSTVDEISVAEGSTTGGAKRFAVTVPAPATLTSYRVLPLSGAEVGPPSNVVQYGSVPPEPPVVEAVGPLTGAPGQQVVFSATLSGGVPETVAWDFGGGASPGTANVVAPAVTLNAAGQYSCSLTVTNDSGSDTLGFFLEVDPFAIAPSVDSVLPTSGQPGAEVQFAGVFSAGEAESFSWDFGGGAAPGTSSEQSPTVTLGALGSYSASLTATNPAGSDTFEFTLKVTGGPSAPYIAGVYPGLGNAGAAIQFHAEIVGGAPDSYSWSFGGGAVPNTSSAAEPSATLGAAGFYTATLTVENEAGSDGVDFTLSVVDSGAGGEPPSILRIAPAGGQSGDEVTFIATLQGAGPVDWEWDFGDAALPAASTDAHPVVTLTSQGAFLVSARATNAFGTDLEFIFVEILPE